MFADLLSDGLLIKKQATDTKTCLYILTKFLLATYLECSTRDSCSVKLNNRKIWHNLYRTEFIIRQAAPLMEQLGAEPTLQNLLNFLTDYCISIFKTPNAIYLFVRYKGVTNANRRVGIFPLFPPLSNRQTAAYGGLP
ncbi:hypothetical protein [Bacteroides acidifaciens]|uniref:hypothetical protein n=1 Tax=Bacteroides acidifaciens TaxID=85831 RepID=UPI0025AF6935|nr:hypothetical protein [Bacteroides acidifaciens]